MMPKGKGQSLIEFAIVLAVSIVLLVGAVQALYAFYLTRQVRAAAEEIANTASAYGGDTADVRDRVPQVLALHRLDPALAEVDIAPSAAPYLEPITVTLTYQVTVRFYGLFDLPIPAQQVMRLSEGG